MAAQVVVATVIVLQGKFHVVTEETATVICYVVVGVPVVLAVLLWLRVSRRRAARTRAAKLAPTAPEVAPDPRGNPAGVSGLRVACSNCGAVAEMAPGAAAHRCPYCQTAIVASQAVIQSGVSSAASAHRRAALEDLFVSRRVGAATAGPFDHSNTPYLFALPFVALCAGMAIRAVAAAQRGETIDELGDFYLPVATALALVVGLLALFLFRRSRRNACRSALRALFASYPATEIETPEALADWLNQHWSVAYATSLLDFGRYFLCTRSTIASYPVLLRGNLWPASEWGSPALHLLLAAQLDSPGSLAAAANQAAGQAVARCRELGFELQFREAGILAVATTAKVDSLRRSPHELGEQGPVLQTLAQIAASLGAAPG